MKQMKNSLLVSAISMFLCISMLIGSTYAWFTDEVSSGVNKIQAGNLQVDLELLDKATGEWRSLKESKAPIFDYDLWEPGYIDAKVLKIENEGNLSLKWSASFYCEYPLTILADVIDVYVYSSESEIGYPADRRLEGYTCVGTLREFINTIEKTTWGTLEAGEDAYLGIALKMREEAGNEYKNLSIGGAFDIRIFATQYISESDSFNNIYDILADGTIVAADSKILSEGEEKIEYCLTADNAIVANVDVPADAVLDPTKPVTVVFDSIDPAETIEVGENTKAYAFDISVTNLKSDLDEDQMITIVVAAPKGLPGLKAYHNGVLIPDAVYDEVAGTITFKTASFSPFAFAYNEYEVSTLDRIRELLKADEEGYLIKLTDDLVIDLSKNGKDRDPEHVLVSGKTTYYNAVNIKKQNVAIDLNGHSITVSCGSAYNSNSDVGALFFVDGGDLNINDGVGGGFIKMANSIYAVWAPYPDPSSVDIYGGIFISDSYALDPLHLADPDPTDKNMPYENSCRCLIYASTGGNINVRGGYFLYNNTPNDSENRNNGAFNCKDHLTDGVHITIHGGVMLINNEYRQNPAHTSTPNGTFDDISVVLADGLKITTEPVFDPITVDGNTYNYWYRVGTYKYKLTYMIGETVDEVVYVEDNTEPCKLKSADEGMRWIDKEGKEITEIPAGNIRDVVVYEDDEEKYVAYFVNKDGEVIYQEEFTRRQSALKDVPEVPELEGYSGKWETYDLKNATGSIVIKPVYSKDADAGELFELDIDELFKALGNGESLIMSQDLEGSQGNASQTTKCVITNSTSKDKDAKLNLNGYALEFDFTNPSGKPWNTFEIRGDSSFTISSGLPGYGILIMRVESIKSGVPCVFVLKSGATLELEKGVVVELHYPAGKDVVMFNVDGMTQDQLLAKYPSLKLTNENGVMRLEVLEDTTITVD